MFRVVATQQGVHNQILREPGEVFDLLRKKDGSYPHAFRREPIRTPEGLPIPGQFKKIPIPAKDGYGREIKGKDGKFVFEHEDYAEDLGNVSITEGANAGENIHLGWMHKVPDSIPEGFYPEGSDFWRGGVPAPIINGLTQLPMVRDVDFGRQSRAAAPIKQFSDDPVRVVAPGTKDRGSGPPARPPGMDGR